ncbi:hypothetical protein TNCV_4380301 [Trichonephila clavipes]|nr:hypothetical protein TNCV_4380301 [Trichonephila clavipes]
MVESEHFGMLESVELTHAESQNFGDCFAPFRFVKFLGTSFLEAEHSSLLFTFGRVSACIVFFYCVENVEFYAFRPRFADSINFLLPSEEQCCRITLNAFRSIQWQCYMWFEKFQNGDFDVRNEELGRPSKIFEDAELQALLDEDDGQTRKNILQKN